MTETSFLDADGIVRLRGTLDPPPGGAQTLEEVLTAGTDGGGLGMTNTGTISTGDNQIDLGSGGLSSDGDATFGSIEIGDAAWSPSGFTTFGGFLKTVGGDFDTSGVSGTGNAKVKGALGVNGVTPNTPELPAIPTPQDIADALLALGLVTQAS